MVDTSKNSMVPKEEKPPNWFYIQLATVGQLVEALDTYWKGFLFIGGIFLICFGILTAIFAVLDYVGVSGYLARLTQWHFSVQVSFETRLVAMLAIFGGCSWWMRKKHRLPFWCIIGAFTFYSLGTLFSMFISAAFPESFIQGAVGAIWTMIMLTVPLFIACVIDDLVRFGQENHEKLRNLKGDLKVRSHITSD